MSSSHSAMRQILALVNKAEADPLDKQRIAMDGLRHAISGQKLFMSTDEMRAYLRIGLGYVESLRPVGYQEEQLVQKIIDADWRLNRNTAIESNLLSIKSLDNSARGKRLTDDATETIVAQALGFDEECGPANAFEALSRSTGRATHSLFEMTEQLERMRYKRFLMTGDSFLAEESRIYKWYQNQIRLRRLPTTLSEAASEIAKPASAV